MLNGAGAGVAARVLMGISLSSPTKECQQKAIPYPGLSNDVRIDCKAAKHSDGDRGTPLADLVHRTAGGVPPASADCSSSPIGLRANKRRFVNLSQQLAGGSYSSLSAQPYSYVATATQLVCSGLLA